MASLIPVKEKLTLHDLFQSEGGKFSHPNQSPLTQLSNYTQMYHTLKTAGLLKGSQVGVFSSNLSKVQ